MGMLEKLNHIFNRVDDPAICFEWLDLRDVRLSQLQKDVLNLITKMKDFPQKRWLLCTDNSYVFLVGFLSLLHLNKELIISANLQPEWLNSISAEFDGLISDRGTVLMAKPTVQLSPPFRRTSETRRTAKTNQSKSFDTLQLDGNEEISLFTSGSTGEAKKIKKRLHCLTNEIESLEKAFNTSEREEVVIATVSHLHIYGLLFKVLWPLLTQRKWLINPVEFQEQIARLGKLNKPIKLVSSPAFLSRLDSCISSKKLDSIFSSGGPLSFESSRLSEAVFQVRPIEVFGSTETGGVGFRQQFSSGQAWVPFDGVHLQVDGVKTTIISPHLDGEEGYPLDDNVKIFKDGSFALEGRKDRIVKLAEKRVSLTEIERFLLQRGDIAECVSIIISGKRDVIGCVIVMKSDYPDEMNVGVNKQLVKTLKDSMRSRFDPVTIPRKWRFVDAIPMNSQSKTDIQALQTLFAKKQVS